MTEDRAAVLAKGVVRPLRERAENRWDGMGQLTTGTAISMKEQEMLAYDSLEYRIALAIRKRESEIQT